MMKDRVCIHHVGGRSGSRSFPQIAALEKYLFSIIYEADESCVNQILNRNKGLASKLMVLPYCLADSCSRRELHINYDPYTSSLYQFNSKYKDYYYLNNDHDYVVKDTFETESTITLETRTLDSVLARDSNVPSPDFLSIDVQGAELDVLRGATSSIKDSVIGIVTEVEFHKLYSGQPLFGDISEYLADRGFLFAKFVYQGSYSPFRAPIGMRADGFNLFSDALFLMDCDHIIDSDFSNKEKIQKLKKLAFVSVVYSQLEYALLCLQKLQYIEDDSLKNEGFESLLFIINEFYKKTRKVYPPTFSDKYDSFDKSNQRFKEGLVKIDESDMSEEHFEKILTLKDYLGNVGLDRLLSLIEKNDTAINKINEQMLTIARRKLYSSKNIVIFGASNAGRTVKFRLGQLGKSASFFIDNSLTKQGQFIEGLMVYDVERSLGSEGMYIVIASTVGNEEIIFQLENIGLKEYYDFLFYRKLPELV